LTSRQSDIEVLAVIGAGTMGHGIAQVSASAGLKVVLFDKEKQALETATQKIHQNLSKGRKIGKVTEEEQSQVVNNLVTTTDLTETAEADLFIEAVPELPDLKIEILRSVEGLVKKEYIFATNTSSIPISEIAAYSKRPDLVVGMHFFNPVHIMQLVEIVVTEKTSEETLKTVNDLARRMKKEPITVRDAPGFASTRLGVALGMEAIRMLEQGVASARDIDKAMELGYNHAMGPLRVTDLIGLDVRLNIAEQLYSSLGTETFKPPEILKRMVSEGKLGRKTGVGFYEWQEDTGKTRTG
jgi:3-hydroxybutyryl-CoA dehydrogenase